MLKRKERPQGALRDRGVRHSAPPCPGGALWEPQGSTGGPGQAGLEAEREADVQAGEANLAGRAGARVEQAAALAQKAVAGGGATAGAVGVAQPTAKVASGGLAGACGGVAEGEATTAHGVLGVAALAATGAAAGLGGGAGAVLADKARRAHGGIGGAARCLATGAVHAHLTAGAVGGADALGTAIIDAVWGAAATDARGIGVTGRLAGTAGVATGALAVHAAGAPAGAVRVVQAGHAGAELGVEVRGGAGAGGGVGPGAVAAGAAALTLAVGGVAGQALGAFDSGAEVAGVGHALVAGVADLALGAVGGVLATRGARHALAAKAAHLALGAAGIASAARGRALAQAGLAALAIGAVGAVQALRARAAAGGVLGRDKADLLGGAEIAARGDAHLLIAADRAEGAVVVKRAGRVGACPHVIGAASGKQGGTQHEQKRSEPKGPCQAQPSIHGSLHEVHSLRPRKQDLIPIWESVERTPPMRKGASRQP